MNLDQIQKKGFSLQEANGKIQSIAFISLRNSLRAYFSTYHILTFSFRNLNVDLDPEESIPEYRMDYIEACCLAITEFHHFTELVIKDILRGEHILLTIDASKKHETFFDLLKGEIVDESKIEKTNEIGFTEALERITALIKSNKLSETKYRFILDNKEFLEKLNRLRNRIMHRGVFILEYEALDFLFGKYVLPFLQYVLELDEYKNVGLWKHKKLATDIDPIDELIKAFQERNYWITKVALLKELGRASYKNPLSGYSFVDDDYVKRAEVIAKHVQENEFNHEVKNCPVCDAKALVLFDDYVDVEDDDGNIINGEYFVYRIECFCCSFQLLSDISDLSEMSLAIENYWEI